MAEGARYFERAEGTRVLVGGAFLAKAGGLVRLRLLDGNTRIPSMTQAKVAEATVSNPPQDSAAYG